MADGNHPQHGFNFPHKAAISALRPGEIVIDYFAGGGGRMTGPKRPAKKRGFTWSRDPAKDGTLSYVLFRRDCNGRLHRRPVTFGPASSRSRIARALRAECRAFREAVDAVWFAAEGMAA